MYNKYTTYNTYMYNIYVCIQIKHITYNICVAGSSTALRILYIVCKLFKTIIGI